MSEEDIDFSEHSEKFNSLGIAAQVVANVTKNPLWISKSASLKDLLLRSGKTRKTIEETIEDSNRKISKRTIQNVANYLEGVFREINYVQFDLRYFVFCVSELAVAEFILAIPKIFYGLNAAISENIVRGVEIIGLEINSGASILDGSSDNSRNYGDIYRVYRFPFKETSAKCVAVDLLEFRRVAGSTTIYRHYFPWSTYMGHVVYSDQYFTRLRFDTFRSETLSTEKGSSIIIDRVEEAENRNKEGKVDAFDGMLVTSNAGALICFMIHAERIDEADLADARRGIELHSTDPHRADDNYLDLARRLLAPYRFTPERELSDHRLEVWTKARNFFKGKVYLDSDSAWMATQPSPNS